MTDNDNDLPYADSVDDLVRANTESNATMLALVASVQAEAEANSHKVDLLENGQRQTRRLLVMVSVLLIVMVLLGIANAINISSTRHNAAVTADAARDANGTYALLLGCLNPDGDCAKRGAAQNRATLDEVKLYELTVLYCARINPAIADPQGADFLECAKRLYPTGPTLKNR